MKTSKFFFVVAAVVAGFSTLGLRDAGAHCQIPCGIYDDAARFIAMKEHVTTIEKSMKQITELGATNQNQSVRWVANKETHADELSEIVTYYFMTQRIKMPRGKQGPDLMNKYNKEMMLLHQILVYSMKAKQTIDTENTKMLTNLIDQFETSYLGKKGASLDVKKVPYSKRLTTLRG